VQGDDEVAFSDEHPPPSRKRKTTQEPSHLQTPISSTLSPNSRKDQSEISPTVQAEIEEMPHRIDEAIKTLKSIGRITTGLLEFKAILDYKQVELYKMWQEIERRENIITTV
jgi:hypothetical protein